MEEDEEKLLFWDLIPCGSLPRYWSDHTWNKLCSTASFPASSTRMHGSDSCLVLCCQSQERTLALLSLSTQYSVTASAFPFWSPPDNQFFIQPYFQNCHGLDTPRKWLEIHALSRNLGEDWAPCSVTWYWNFSDCWRLNTAYSTKLHPMWEHPPVLFSFTALRSYTGIKSGNWSKEKSW